MAVNKNFVIKNGLEVNTNLILANADTNKVGIGSTAPRFELDVAGGIGATDFYLSGIGTFANELNVGTDGSVLTALGVGGSVGVGTALPAYLLDVRSTTSTGTTALYVQGDVRVTGDLSVDDISFDQASINSLNVTGVSTFLSSVNVQSGLLISGITTISNTTNSTTFNNGALVIDGGLGVEKNVNVGGDLNVTGNVSLGGTTVTLKGVDVYIENKDIILGFTTTITPNDNTANHAGVAIASTEGNPLVSFSASGINTLPDTYKQMMWFRSGTLGFSTDIFALNYGLAIGTTTVSNGVRLAVGSNVTVTDNAVNATTGNFTAGSITNLSGTNLNYSGISTLGNVRISSGIVTATSGIVTYYGDGSKLTGVISGVGINTAGGVVGTGATILDFRGAGISTVTVSAGIATINITGGGGGGGSVSISSVAPSSPSNGNLWYSIEYGRTFIYYDEVALGVGATAVWIDAAPFNQGGLYINKYGDNMYAGLGVTIGSLTNPSVYFNGYTNSGFYSPEANQFGIVLSGIQKLNVNSDGINVVGVATATSFKGSAQVGIATGGSYIGLATQFNFIGSGIGITHVYNSVVGIATITLTSTATGGGGGSGLFNTGITSSVGYLVTGSMATAYTAPSTAGNEHIVHSIHITNIDGTNSADISGQMYAGQYSIANTVPVPAGSSVELLKQPKILAPSETIQLQASATNSLHATITIETKTGDTTYVGVGTDITSSATYTDLWTATANSMLQSVLLANDDGSVDVKARVVWTDGSNNIQGYYAYDITIPADATVEVLEQPKYLPSGYKVRVYANQANRLEAILAARTIA